MSRQVKFTSFGVPYVLEFENVSFVPEQPRRRSPSPSSSTSSFCYIDSLPTPPRRPSFSFRSPSSFFKRKHAPIIPATTFNDSLSKSPPCCAISESESTKSPSTQSHASEANGIYIRIPPECSLSALTRKERLVHLQRTISVAVLDAGMSRSPGNSIPEKHSSGDGCCRGYRTPDALFCGTYGQMMAALEGAGLSATPCAGEDLPGYTRLGALFVARNNGGSEDYGCWSPYLRDNFDPPRPRGCLHIPSPDYILYWIL